MKHLIPKLKAALFAFNNHELVETMEKFKKDYATVFLMFKKGVKISEEEIKSLVLIVKGKARLHNMILRNDRSILYGDSGPSIRD